MSALQRIRADFAGKRIAILGLGREGLALARLFSSLGFLLLLSDDRPLEELPQEVRQFGDLGAQIKCGGLSLEALKCDSCFVSPGIPLSHPVVARVATRGIELWNEPRFFLRYCPAETVIGVTGSSGKSTTASLIAAALRGTGRRVYLGGNIGRPLVGELAHLQAEDAVVLELSSFQLQLFKESPKVAAITNIAPNHLDRHADMAEYIAAKANVFRHQREGGAVVLNADQEVSRQLAACAPGAVSWFSCFGSLPSGAWLKGDELVLADGTPLCRASELKLRGQHNLANALAAAAACDLVGVPPEAIARGLTSFTGLPHRLELVECIDGVSWYNDSIATTPERSIAAMHAFNEPILLLAGGRDKHLPWEAWAEEAKEHALGVVAFGEAGDMIAALLRARAVPVQRVRGLRDAVHLARNLAPPGCVVLLSPGCASYDEFRDFEDRGEAFRALVRSLRT